MTDFNNENSITPQRTLSKLIFTHRLMPSEYFTKDRLGENVGDIYDAYLSIKDALSEIFSLGGVLTGKGKILQLGLSEVDAALNRPVLEYPGFINEKVEVREEESAYEYLNRIGIVRYRINEAREQVPKLRKYSRKRDLGATANGSFRIIAPGLINRLTMHIAPSGVQRKFVYFDLGYDGSFEVLNSEVSDVSHVASLQNHISSILDERGVSNILRPPSAIKIAMHEMCIATGNIVEHPDN